MNEILENLFYLRILLLFGNINENTYLATCDKYLDDLVLEKIWES